MERERWGRTVARISASDAERVLGSQTAGEAQQPLEHADPLPQSVAYTWSDVAALSERLASRLYAEIVATVPDFGFTGRWKLNYVYAIPTGGSVVLPFFLAAVKRATGRDLTALGTFDETLADETIVLDDVADSGRTIWPFLEAGSLCAVLVQSRISHFENHARLVSAVLKVANEYVVFPWEGAVTGPEDAVRRILTHMGYDIAAPGLRDTPRRVLSWYERFRKRTELDFKLTRFEAEHYGGMVLCRELPFVSLCEHHLLPFRGTATLAYIPGINTGESQGLNGYPIIGLSKLARIVQHYASQLQVQERMTEAIANEVKSATRSPDVACLVSAEHMCMSLRGPEVPDHQTVTSTLLGKFLNDATVRAEFMALARNR